MIRNGVEFEFTGESWDRKGHGRVYNYRLIGSYTYDQVSKALRGQNIYGKIIKGIEMFAVTDQTNKDIGIRFES